MKSTPLRTGGNGERGGAETPRLGLDLGREAVPMLGHAAVRLAVLRHHGEAQGRELGQRGVLAVARHKLTNARVDPHR
jgi:hypothetical protein